MVKNMKFIWAMLVLTIFLPLAVFLWGDNLIMLAARQSIKKADTSQASEYFQRLETFFPASRLIPEARFYKAGILIQNNPQSAHRIYRFIGYDGRLISQNFMPPANDHDKRQALDILHELDTATLDKNSQWIKKYLPWYISKTYYELGKADKALEILSTVNYNEPEASWPLVTWAGIQMDMNNYIETVKAVDDYLNTSNDLQEGMTAKLFEIRGDASLALGRTDDAEGSYKKAKQYVKHQFTWLSRQRFVKCIRPELVRENFEKDLDAKISRAELIKKPLDINNNDRGIYGNLSIGSKPIIGEAIYMVSAGEDILFSGSLPAANVTYTDVNGNFYFPEDTENPVFGVGVSRAQAKSLSLSLKVDHSQSLSIYGLELVPAVKIQPEIRGKELFITFEPVPDTARYELYIIPPEKEPAETKEIALDIIFPDNNSDPQITWKQNLAEIVRLKPFPLLYDDIKPYHIIGPLYPEQKSFLNIKAFDKNNNLLSDSFGFYMMGVNDDSAPGISLKESSIGDTYAAEGLYVHAAEEYENTLQENPTDTETMDKLIRLYLWAPGVKDIMKAQEVMTKLKPNENPKAFQIQAEIDYRMNRFEQVRRVLEGALKENGLDAAGYHILAQISLANHEYEKCIKYLEQVYYLAGEKLKDYSLITAYCLVSDFDGAYTAAQDTIYDGQRFFDLLGVIRTEDYRPEVMQEFKKMLLPLTRKPDKTVAMEFDEAYKDFKKLYPEHDELFEIAFKLAFRRFQ